VLGCAIMYILLITEHKGDVSLQKKKKMCILKKIEVSLPFGVYVRYEANL